MISEKRELHRCKCEAFKVKRHDLTHDSSDLDLQLLEPRSIMIVNNTCVPGNDTSECPVSGSSAGQAVGLTFFFLLLVIVVGLVVYKYHSVIWNMLPFRHRRSQKKEDFREAEAESHPYTSMRREQPDEQAPIYENLNTGTAGHSRPSANQSGLSGEPEEDVYLQCDSPDDAIYSNDPACSLSILPDGQEEDVYIVPDS